MEENVKEENTSKITKYLICLKKGWFILVVFTVIGLLLGLIIANKSFNPPCIENNYVTLNFRYTNNIVIDYDEIISEKNIERTKKITKSLETGSKISTYKLVKIEDIKIVKNDGYYTIYADMNSFNVGENKTYSDTVAKGFLKHLTILPLITDEEIEKYNKTDDKGNIVFQNFDKEFYKTNSLDSDGKILIIYSDPEAASINHNAKVKYYSILITSTTLGFLLLGLIFVYIYIDKLNLSLEKKYDNIEIYRTPFHLSFFKKSIHSLSNLKSLVFLALILGMVMVSKYLTIPSGFADLGLGFGYLFLSIACMIFGPIPSLLIGVLSDVLGFMVKPSGQFFIGYTFQAVVACFTYGMLFYKTHITFSRVLLARVIVNFFCNVFIGTLCKSFTDALNYEQAMVYVLTISLPKNLVYLLPQSLLLFFVLKAVTIPLSALNVINPQIAESVSFF